VHVGGWQLPRLHTVLTQSVTVLHAAPTSHGGQASPPQSTSDSLPLRSPSVQLGAWQTLFAQKSVVQSLAMVHALGGSQAGHPVPPQSTSVSLPFRS
jgi:hypothetical protein